MQGKRLEVTRSELLELRNQGISNKDIADALEVSVATVYNYIGGQGFRKDGVVLDRKQTPPINTVPELPEVKFVSQIVAVNGFVFDINMAERSFVVQHPYQQGFFLRLDDAENFKSALGAVAKLIDAGVS